MKCNFPKQVVSPSPSILQVHRHCHVHMSGGKLRFGLTNIPSLNKKLDDWMEVCQKQCINVPSLCGTQHDPDSVWIDNFESNGFQIVKWLHPCSPAPIDCLDTNHGGDAILSVTGVTEVNIASVTQTFDFAGFIWNDML